MNFELISDYQPTGDQPEAIAQLTEGIRQHVPAQTLLGVTGSGKTFTIANVIKNINKPTLILSHNKTLAAQLYGEFKNFFPHNAVEYYVSYYDYYQPEAYIPSTDTYIEKDLAINEEIDKLRLAATSSLLSGRKDVIVVSSVSCIYGMGNPADFYNNVIEIKKGKLLDRNVFLRRLVDSLYVRNDIELNRGNFRVKGDTVDIFLAYTDSVLRVMFWDDEIDGIEEIDPVSGHRIGTFEEYKIYPANLFMTTKESTLRAIHQIEDDLTKQVAYFEEIGKPYEAKRLYERVTYDMEMLRELGHCSGIENYSRYFDGREPGTRPYCLLDFFRDFTEHGRCRLSADIGRRRYNGFAETEAKLFGKLLRGDTNTYTAVGCNQIRSQISRSIVKNGQRFRSHFNQVPCYGRHILYIKIHLHRTVYQHQHRLAVSPLLYFKNAFHRLFIRRITSYSPHSIRRVKNHSSLLHHFTGFLQILSKIFVHIVFYYLVLILTSCKCSKSS